MFDISVTTTNGIERQHRMLKENFLKENGFGGTLTSLLTILIKKFIPSMEAKYVKSNVMSLEQYKQYSHHLPQFLRGKPLSLISHCLHRMPPKTEPIEKSQIKEIQKADVLQFSVSSNSGTTYNVDYEHNVPVCSCPDFSKHHWPCKHVLAIFEHFPEHGWDSLNGVYTNQPCFNLDSEIIKVVSDDIEPAVVDETGLDTELPRTDNSTTADKAIHVIPDMPEHSTKETDPVRVRKTCVELLKTIQNHLYATDTVGILCDAREKLNEIDSFLDDHSSKICDIPRRHKRSAKKFKVKVGKSGRKSNTVKTPELVEEIVTFENQVAEETEVDVPLSQEYEAFIEVVDEVWKSSTDEDYQIGKVGPYILTAKSIQFLQSTLSDEVG